MWINSSCFKTKLIWLNAWNNKCLEILVNRNGLRSLETVNFVPVAPWNFRAWHLHSGCPPPSAATAVRRGGEEKKTEDMCVWKRKMKMWFEQLFFFILSRKIKINYNFIILSLCSSFSLKNRKGLKLVGPNRIFILSFSIPISFSS